MWKDVKGYEGFYEVSSLGEIRNKKYLLLKQRKCSSGYYMIDLLKFGQYRTIRVHRIVAAAFLDNPLRLPVVNHLDGNRENNKVENLEWCTQKHNIIDAIDKGRWRNMQIASRKITRNLPVKPVLAIFLDGSIANYKSRAEATKLLNIRDARVSDSINTGKPYKTIVFKNLSVDGRM